MLTLIHGDDLVKIEKSIIDLTSNSKPDRVDGSKIKLKDLEEKLLGGDLFGDETVFIIEGIFKNKGKKEILKFLETNKGNFSAIFVERGKLNKRDLDSLKFNAVVNHLLPQYYFKFLDDFYPKNGNNLANIYSELLKTMTAEQIYYSLVKRVRALMAVRAGLNAHSEIARFAPWQLGKLKQQSRMWEERDLIDFYKTLFDIEVKMKSGGLTTALEKYLDIVIRTELN